MSKAIQDRVEEEALQRRATPMPMSEKASDPTPPDLPTTANDCPQADPGVLASADLDLGCGALSGSEKRNLRLRRFGQLEEDLWRAAPAALYRRGGSTRLAGSVESMGLVTKLIDRPVALVEKPDCCTPELFESFLRVQRQARTTVSSRTERLDRLIQGSVRSLCTKQPDVTGPFLAGELRRQKNACTKRAADCLDLWASE